MDLLKLIAEKAYIVPARDCHPTMAMFGSFNYLASPYLPKLCLARPDKLFPHSCSFALARKKMARTSPEVL